MDGKIALEEHISAEQNNRHWDAEGEDGRNGWAYSQNVEAWLLNPGMHLVEMDRAGIEHAILSLTSPDVQSVVDRDEAADLARRSNDQLATVIRKHPDRFSGFAAVALQDPRAAADELERAVLSLGFKGALINGFTNMGDGDDVQYLDEAPAWEFWERVAALNVPVYLHPREPLPSQRRTLQGYPELIGSAWGFAWETGGHAVRLILSGLFDKYPNLQVILGHFGEGLPYLLPRMQHRIDEQREGERGAKAAHRPIFYLGRNFWVTTSGHFHSKLLLDAIAQMGAERVLFSVDFPYEQMDVAGRWFDDTVLGDHEKYRIGRGNAVDLFNLELGQLPERAVAGFAS